MRNLAVLFDLDGVISDTASVHSRAWKMVFDLFAAGQSTAFVVFHEPDDYLIHLDGKTRLAGIESFLHSRGLELPLGEGCDEGLDTVCGIGNVKNRLFRELLERDGVRIFDDAVRLIDRLRAEGTAMGVASSSKNAAIVLARAGLTDCFSTIMDGLVAEHYGVASKPSPEFYKFAASLIGRRPGECIVIEDALSGVASAAQAGIGKVIGLARGHNMAPLLAHGATVVVNTLDDLVFEELKVIEAA